MQIDSPKGLARQGAPGVVPSQLALPLQSAEPEGDKKICEQCGGKFSPRAASGGKPQRFCSPQCRAAFHADAHPNVSQRNPTCSAQTASPAVTPPAQKDEPADAGKDFSWKDDDSVVLREQPDTAVYFNPHGGLVIRQYRWPEDDSFVVISAECIDHFVHKLTDIVGIKILGR